MKIRSIFFFVLILISTRGYSQDTVKEIVCDSIDVSAYFLELISDYREEKGLKRLILDTGLNKACHYQAKHMAKWGCATHSSCKGGSLDDHNIFTDGRIRMFDGYIHKGFIECCLNIGIGFSTETYAAYPIIYPHHKKFREVFDKGVFDYKLAAAYALAGWKNSPPHNRGLLDDRAIYGGVYMYVYKNPTDNSYRISAVYLGTF
jgi:hypothetical protein